MSFHQSLFLDGRDQLSLNSWHSPSPVLIIRMKDVLEILA